MKLKQLWRRRWLRWLDRRIPPASSIVLRNRSIFIAPSGVGAAFAVALLLLLLAAINYQNSLVYGLTFLLGSLFVVSIFHTYRNLLGLQLSTGPTQPVYPNQSAEFKLYLSSTGRTHQALLVGWQDQEAQRVSVPAQQRVELVLPYQAKRRGWLRPGRLRVETHYPLGLLRAWTWLDLHQQTWVYPLPLEAPLPLTEGLSDGEDDGQKVVGQGVDDFQGLRTYVPGDSRRRLHWKAYSKGQGLLVKDFAALAGRELSLDFMALSGDVEFRLSVLCHWARHYSQQEQSYSLRLPGVFIAVGQGAVHRDHCLKQLALFGCNDG